MMKNGYTSAGRHRWRCPCGASQTLRKPGKTRIAIFTTFLSYLLGKLSQAEISTNTGRGLRRRWAWCWTVPTPTIQITGQVHNQLFIDGIYLPHKWCLLLAHNGTHVVARQWCHQENSAAYTALLKKIPPPDLVATDGHGGAAKALKALWPEMAIQRCLVHVHRNNLRDLTSRPNTAAGKALLALSRRLLKVSTKEEAATWVKLLIEINTQYGDYLKERTHAKDVPAHQRRKGRTWWYTHDRDRRVYHRLASLHGKGHLFAFLEFNPARERTTNPVESFNRRLRLALDYHRGLSESHMITMIDWICYHNSEFSQQPQQILADWEKAGRPSRRTIPAKKHQPTQPPQGPEHYGTALNAEEGLWQRKGWAGRSKQHPQHAHPLHTFRPITRT